MKQLWGCFVTVVCVCMLRVQRVVVYGSSSSSQVLLTLCPIPVAARWCCYGCVCSWAFQYRIASCSLVSQTGFDSIAQMRPAHVLWCWSKVRSEYLIGSVGSSHVEVETFLRNGHPSAFLVGNFSSYSQVPKNSTLLASFSPVSCLELVGFQRFRLLLFGYVSYSSLPSRH